ncbi:MAG: DUF1294 domain-containing protein [Methanoregula sp.]|nr:DUF1294 domain-containing protein [Methanoregula sp.]
MIPLPEIPILACIWLGLNAIAFLFFAHDKRTAGRGSWRTPEATLLLLALLGPFGAYGAMRVFRHKTRKGKFHLVPVFLLLQVILLSLLIGQLLSRGS